MLLWLCRCHNGMCCSSNRKQAKKSDVFSSHFKRTALIMWQSNSLQIWGLTFTIVCQLLQYVWVRMEFLSNLASIINTVQSNSYFEDYIDLQIDLHGLSQLFEGPDQLILPYFPDISPQSSVPTCYGLIKQARVPRGLVKPGTYMCLQSTTLTGERYRSGLHLHQGFVVDHPTSVLLPEVCMFYSVLHSWPGSFFFFLNGHVQSK